MGPTSRATAFARALRVIAAPVLSAHGFMFDGKRTFRQLSDDRQACRIIHFQLGQRSLAGKFTVNLGVFTEGDSPGVGADRAHEHDCRFDRRARLGTLIPARFPGLARLPVVGLFFRSRDKWWRFPDDPAATDAAVSAAVGRIVARGFPWFDAVAGGIRTTALAERMPTGRTRE